MACVILLLGVPWTECSPGACRKTKKTPPGAGWGRGRGRRWAAYWQRHAVGGGCRRFGELDRAFPACRASRRAGRRRPAARAPSPVARFGNDPMPCNVSGQRIAAESCKVRKTRRDGKQAWFEGRTTVAGEGGAADRDPHSFQGHFAQFAGRAAIWWWGPSTSRLPAPEGARQIAMTVIGSRRKVLRRSAEPQTSGLAVISSKARRRRTSLRLGRCGRAARRSAEFPRWRRVVDRTRQVGGWPKWSRFRWWRCGRVDLGCRRTPNAPARPGCEAKTLRHRWGVRKVRSKLALS